MEYIHRDSNLSFLVFTNEKNFNILHVTLSKLIESVKNVDIPIYVVSNSIPVHKYFDGVNYIETNEPYSSQGFHFRNSLLKALNIITTEYIVYFCDDYLVNSPVKTDNLNNLMKLIHDTNCDYFSFSSLNYCDVTISKWERPNINLANWGLPGGTLYRIPDDFRHLYSVQPCIWKKRSLIELLTYNEQLSIRDLDNTQIKNKKGLRRTFNYDTNYFESTTETALDYGFINYTINYPPYTYNIDDKLPGSDYFIFDYGEVVRYGRVIEGTNSGNIFRSILSNFPDIREKLTHIL